MVRKRRTKIPGGGESSGSQETSGRRGAGAIQPSPQQQQQQGGGGAAQRLPQWQQQQGGGGAAQQPPQQQQLQQGGGGYQGGGGRGWAPQQQVGGYQGRGGYGGGRGGMASQPYYGGPPEYQQQQGRGTQQQQQQPRGPPPQSRGGGMGVGGRGGIVPSAGGPSRPSLPELHQATQAPHQSGLMTQPMPCVKAAEVVQSGASSSSLPEPTSQVIKQFQHLCVQKEPSSGEAVQPNPASSKSFRFPLRPGKGSTGSRCTVKANHFVAELPDKDLHQYDVSITPEVMSRGVNRAVMEQLVKLYRESHLGKRLLHMMVERVYILQGLSLLFRESSESFSLMKTMDRVVQGERGNSKLSSNLLRVLTCTTWKCF